MSETNKIKYLSTTALAKKLNMPVKKLFEVFLNNGFIEKDNDNWTLTEKGKKKGGTIKTHPKLGTYIAWAWDDTSASHSNDSKAEQSKLLTTSALSKYFGLSKFRMNPILSEQGLVQKSENGWVVTKL